MPKRIADHTVKIEDLDKETSKDKTKEIKQKASNQEKEVKKVKKTKTKKIRGKNYKLAKSKILKSDSLKSIDAIEKLKKIKYSKFDESVELHINLYTDPKNNDQKIRFTTTPPHPIGKEMKILVISDKKIKSSPNVNIKDKSAINDILKGKITPNKDFHVLITTPNNMSDLAKVAKILGPKGLMPSPKNNTVTEKIEDSINELSKGKIEIKSQNNHSVIHQIIGKLSNKSVNLDNNVNHILKEVQKHTPAKLKTKLIKSAYIKTTMSPSIKVKV